MAIPKLQLEKKPKAVFDLIEYLIIRGIGIGLLILTAVKLLSAHP